MSGGLVAAAVIVVVLVQGVRTEGTLLDDGYILLRYADNILSGDGWVFNEGELHNVATSPLQTLIYVVQGALFGVEQLPTIARLNTLAWMLIACWLVHRLMQQRGPLVASGTALALALLPHLYRTVGLQTAMSVAFTAWALDAYQREKWTGMSVALGLLVVTRLESVLLVGLVFVVIAVRRQMPLRSIVRKGVVALSPLVVWLAFSWTTFGRLLPESLDAKIWQAESGGWGTGALYFDALGRYLAFAFMPWTALLDVAVPIGTARVLHVMTEYPSFGVATGATAMLVVLGVAAVVRRRPSGGLLLLVGWLTIHSVLYGVVLGVVGYHWYFTLAVLVAAWLLVEGVTVLPRKLRFPVTCGVLLVLGSALILDPRGMLGMVDARNEPHARLAAWVKKNTPDNAVLVHDETGQLAFLSDRRMIDTSGLTTPQYLDRLASGQRPFLWFGALTRGEEVYVVSVRGAQPPRFARAAFTDLLVYDRDDAMRTRLYRLRHDRFRVPGAEEVSLFDLEHLFEGNTIQTLMTLEPDHVVVPGAHLAPDSGSMTVWPASRWSALQFVSGFPMEAIKAGSDGIEFLVRFRYTDGSSSTHKGAHRIARDAKTNHRLVRIPVDTSKPVKSITISSTDVDTTHDWWGVCNPVLVR